MMKQKPIRSERHRRFIASLPCVMTGKFECQAAHIRHNGGGGMGYKPGDNRCIPLNWEEHHRQGEVGEKAFWGDNLDRAIWLAGQLWDHTGDREKCLELIGMFRRCQRAS